MVISPDIEFAAVAIALIGNAAYREFLRHQRRILIHQERLAAIEKGLDLLPLEQEQKRSSWNVQRTLLLAGLVWLSLGVCLYVTLAAVLSSPANEKLEVVPGIQWIGIGPAAIGISHLIVYFVGKKKEHGSSS